MKKFNLKRLSMLIICLLFLAVLLPINSNAASKLSLSNKKITLYAKMDSKTITVKNLSDNQKVKWTTSNKKVATVKDGKITPKKKGTATITAKIGKKKLTCTVTVKNITTYNYTYNSKSGYSSSKLNENGSEKSLYLKVGKDLPEGIYKVAGYMSGKEVNGPGVYVKSKKNSDIFDSLYYIYNTDDVNGDLIEVKKGQWIEMRVCSNEKIIFTPSKFVKTYDAYSTKIPDGNLFVYKVGRDIPAGEYRIYYSWFQGYSSKNDYCDIAIADSLFYVRSLCEWNNDFIKLKNESGAQTFKLLDYVDEQHKVDFKITLKNGEWICSNAPLSEVK